MLEQHVISRMDSFIDAEGKWATEIVEEIGILKAIGWLKNAQKLVTEITIKNCFKKWEFPEVDSRKGSFIKYICKIFQKTNLSYPTIRTRTSANFVNILN